MASDPPIIIRGGSVVIEFDESQLPPDGRGKFRNADKKIKRIEITGDYDRNSGVVYNNDVVIKIFYG